MKFCINKEIGYVNPDRIQILKREEDYFERGDLIEVKYLCNLILKTTQDWDEQDPFPIVGETDSIQYRPKGIFGNKKGIYYKDKGKTVYLTEEETTEMFNYVGRAINHLNGKDEELYRYEGRDSAHLLIEEQGGKNNFTDTKTNIMKYLNENMENVDVEAWFNCYCTKIGKKRKTNQIDK